MTDDRGGEFTFRRLTRDDFELLAVWLAEPHVARWWNHQFTPAAIERDFGTSIDGGEPNADYVAELDGRPIGLIQCSFYTDYPEYLDELAPSVEVPPGAVSIDYLIGPTELVGHGVGRRMIAAFCTRIWVTMDAATCVVVPVQRDNETSWRALLGAGFRLVADAELEPDNPVDTRNHVVARLDRPGG